MILPTKHISTNESFIGAGADILSELINYTTISDLWETVRNNPSILTFERFILTLDMLHILGAISLENNFIKRINYDP